MENDNRTINEVVSCAPALNYYRLAKLTMVEGTNQVRNCVLNHLPSCQSFHTALQRKQNCLRQLYKNRVISKKQWQLLYPEHNNADSTCIDLTLWIVLLKKITILDSRNINWNDAPGPEQTEWYHDVLRIRETRNNLSHLTRPELDTPSFDTLWNETISALRRLNENIDFDEYYNTSLDRETLRTLQQLVNEQVLQEKNSVLQYELDQRQKMFYVAVVGLTCVIFIVMAAVVGLVFLIRDNKPCSAFLVSQDVDDSTLQMIPRDGWTKRAPHEGLVYRSWPSQYVIYTHTADTAKCKITDECCARLRNIQEIHMFTNHNWSDIAFHYIIDGAGLVYLGRNHDVVPSSVLHYNNLTISVAIIGDYNYWHPSDESIASLEQVLRYVRSNNWVTADYKLMAMCEVRNFDSPGFKMYDKINGIYNQCNESSSIAHSYREICHHLKYNITHSFCPKRHHADEAADTSTPRDSTQLGL